MKLPKAVLPHVAGRSCTLDAVGHSGSTIALFDDRVLKIEPAGRESDTALRMMTWLSGHLPVPRVIASTQEDGLCYTLMTRVTGEMACAPRYMRAPQTLTGMLADALRMLWRVPVTDCPVRQTLDEKLRLARSRVEGGLVDVHDVEPETFGPGGFEGPAALLEWLETHRPPEDLVLSHGDFCLPNVFMEDGHVSGLIDLGRAGAADRWQDIALCLRSLRHNAQGRYGPAYPGFDEGLLLRALGMAPDSEKIRYYLLLDELF